MKLLRQLGNSVVGFIDAPMPELTEDGVLIRTAITALCGSELKAYRGRGVAEGNLGHEAAGVVVAVGSDISHLTVGQRVGISAFSGCGRCDYCREGAFTWCSDRSFHRDMHAEYIAAPARCCTPLPDAISWEAGVLVSGDGLGVPYHSSKRFDVPDGEAVAVVGLGPIGLGAVLMQKHLGRRVIGVDISPERLAYARSLGAADVVLAAPDTDIPQALRDLTGGKGPAVCIEAAGLPETVQTCFAAVRKGGTVVFNGELKSEVLAPTRDFIRGDIAAVGIWYFHIKECAEMIELVQLGLDAEALISHRFHSDEADEAFRAMSGGETAKAILRWSAFERSA
jgi:threonine dehydrogenase-like Zn-dependent dehydrogenase